MTNRFDDEAAQWDSNQDIILINDRIASLVLPDVLQSTDSVLELGCGTGILTFAACSSVSIWFAIDTSPGMINALNSKKPKFPRSDNVTAKVMFLEHSNQVETKYDWGVSAMVFHHIPDMQETLSVLAKVTRKGVVVVDYQAWEGSRVFHPESKMEGVCRHGLDKADLARMCKEAGFREVETKVGFTLTLNREGKDVEFPFLVIIARH